jgi:hypothetical protein
MEDSRPPLTPNPKDDTIDLVAEARRIKRTMLFWRRLVMLVLGLALLIVVVAWQRTTLRCRECAQSLQQYGSEAIESHLEREPLQMLDARWQQLSKEVPGFTAAHYELLPQNWLRTPGPGEVLPLAICRDDHVTFMGRGRHVLFREAGKPVYVKWLSEEEAKPILDQLHHPHHDGN